MGGTSLIINTNAMTNLSNGSSRVDVARDFAPIILCATGANVLSVQQASSIRSLKELVSSAKAKPGRLTFGTSGVGSSNHMSGCRGRIRKRFPAQRRRRGEASARRFRLRSRRRSSRLMREASTRRRAIMGKLRPCADISRR
ncbi:MAG: tripartite tricarboxylate transporter substrate-binding protein [Burkholderiales bacterium]